VRDDTVDEPNRLQLGGGPPVAEHQHLEQDLSREVSCQDRLDHHRPDPDVDLWRAEVGGVDSDQQVARAGQAEAAGEGVPVDAAHDRFPECGHNEEELDIGMPSVVPFELGDSGLERGQVGSGAEHPVAGPGQDDDSHHRLLLAPHECRDEVAQHAGRKRVALLGPVQGYGGDVPVDGEQGLL
jgi:hypothetical protein